MTKQKLVSVGREGFTLAEMLVAMALLAVLAAVVVPSILRQVGKGDATRVASDLRSISEASEHYYAEKFVWPKTIDELASGTAPFLNLPNYKSTDGIRTGGNGVIADSDIDNGVIKVTGISGRVAARVDLLIDGVQSGTQGRVTYTNISADSATTTGFEYKIRNVGP